MVKLPLSVSQKERLGKIIEDVRRDVVDELQTSDELSQNPVARKNLIRKIETLKFPSPESAFVKSNTKCWPSIAQAFYFSTNHTIVLCPQILAESTEHLMFVLGHEMGHAIDPCGFKSSVYQLDPDRSTRVDELKDLQSRRGGSIYDALKVSNQSSLSMKSLSSFFSNESLVEIARGVTSDEYPFKNGYVCLTKAPFFFKTSADSSAVASRGQWGAVDACKSMGQMTEVMGDWMGAKVLGRYLARHPPESDAERFAALGELGKWMCPRPPSVSNTIVRAIRWGLAKLTPSSADQHPGDEDRVMKIILQEPSVRQAFQCDVSKESCFPPLRTARRATDNRNQKQEGTQK